MSGSRDKVQSLVNYYLREGFTHSVHWVCEEILKRSPNDAFLQFWKAYAMFATGSVSQSMPMLRSLQHHEECGLAATATLLAASIQGQVMDSEYELSATLDNDLPMATESSKLLLAIVHWHSKLFEKALLALDRLEAGEDVSLEHSAKTVRGWVIVSQLLVHDEDDPDDQHDDMELQEAADLFEEVLQRNGSHIEALLGRAKVAEVRDNMAAALDAINEVHVRHSWFAPALVDKLRVALPVHGWPEVMDAVAQLQQLDANNVMAFAYTVVHSLAVDGNTDAAGLHMKDLFQAISKTEPRNAALMVRVAQPISRVACGEAMVLNLTQQLLESAVKMSNNKPEYVQELARQHILSGDYGAAKRLMLRESDTGRGLSNMLGLMLAESEALSGDIRSALSTHSLYASTLDTAEESAYSAYVAAVIAIIREPKPEDSILALERAVQAHVDLLQGLPVTFDFFTRLDPSRAVVLVRLMLEKVALEPSASSSGGNESPFVGRCIAVLNIIARHMPKLHALQLLHARALYLNSSYEAAMRKLTEILANKPSEVEAHLMQANIFLAQGRPSAAQGSLNAALSGNFGVKSWPLYHVIHGRIRLMQAKAEDDDSKKREILEEAHAALTVAYALPGVVNEITREQFAMERVRVPTLHERASIICMYASCLHQLAGDRESPEAHQILQNAEVTFAGTAEEVNVLVTSCEMAINKQDVGNALKKLRRIPQDSPMYRGARLALADIYITHRKDRRAYAACHLDLVQKYDDYDSHCNAGDAFLHIQEPEKAIEMYTEAIQRGTENAHIFSKIGKTYMMMHAYKDAATFYAKAVKKSPADVALRQEKAALLTKMRQLEMAETELAECDSWLKTYDEDSMERLMLDVKTKLMRANIAKIRKDSAALKTQYTLALERQQAVLARLRGEHLDVLAQHRALACEITCHLAEIHASSRKFAEAIAQYRAALAIQSDYIPAMLQLAKLHLSTGDLDACQQQCNDLLRVNATHEEALIMLAELLFLQGQFETAHLHFVNLLEANPNHAHARAQMIQCLRRAGKTEEIRTHLIAAERLVPKGAANPGYLYCRALLHRFQNKLQDALSDLNAARASSALSADATYLMMDTYLTPITDAMWASESVDPQEADIAISACQQLLSSLPASEKTSNRWKVFSAYTTIAGADPKQVEDEIAELLGMAQIDPNNVPVLLAVATGFVKLQQVPKARNQLKRIQKTPYNPADAEDFERTWLLLATIHIGAGKYDLAEECCSRCLKYNKSCGRAWELKGVILEKESSYQTAADCYQKAWDLSNHTNPAVGYRLAWNFLKAVRYVDAIDVASAVLKSFPDYPKISDDIIMKAVAKILGESERDEKQRLGLIPAVASETITGTTTTVA